MSTNDHLSVYVTMFVFNAKLPIFRH